MQPPSFFGKIVQVIEDGGMERAELAKRLRVSPSMIAQIKRGALPADDKMEILAELTGGRFTAKELMLAKMVQWIESKGVDPVEVGDFAKKKKLIN